MLDFKAISQAIPFKKLLDHLGLFYEESETVIKGKIGVSPFIIAKAKNLFLMPYEKDVKGSVINFLSYYDKIGLKDAALKLQKTFLTEKAPEREIPDLKLHYSPVLNKLGITIDTCRDLEFGLVKERSVMAGKIAFTIRDIEGEKQGYVGWSETQGWYFPRGHRQKHVFGLHKAQGDSLTLYDDAFAMVLAYQAGERNLGALMSSNMTDEQAVLLLRFQTIIVKCKNPYNIAQRLMMNSFVKVQPSC